MSRINTERVRTPRYYVGQILVTSVELTAAATTKLPETVVPADQSVAVVQAVPTGYPQTYMVEWEGRPVVARETQLQPPLFG